MQPSLLTRLRWRLEDLADAQDARATAGLLVAAVLVLGGFFAARAVGSASSAVSRGAASHVVTLDQRVPVRADSRVVTRWRLRTVSAPARTLIRTQTIHAPSDSRVVADRPVTRYRLVYRPRTVVSTETRTVTATETVTETVPPTTVYLTPGNRPPVGRHGQHGGPPPGKPPPHGHH